MRRNTTLMAGFTGIVNSLPWLAALAHPAFAESISWSNAAGGTFQTGSNWFGGVAPGSADEAHFALVSGTVYTVSFGSNVSNDSLGVGEGSAMGVGENSVTFDLGGSTYTLLTTGFSTSVEVSSGQLHVTNGTLATTGNIRVVGFGNTELTIANNGAVSASQLSIGEASLQRIGNVTVTGAGSTLTLSRQVFIGNGTMTIANGASVSSDQAAFGFEPDDQFTVTVTGPGSTWTVSPGDITVSTRSGSTGTMTIEDGAQVSTKRGFFLGGNPGAVSTVLVTGSGSSLNAGAVLLVGWNGDGTMTIANGASVLSDGGGLTGLDTGSVGRLTVTGLGSSWIMPSRLWVGDGGNGTLAIMNGGLVSSGTATIGIALGSQGEVTVSGPGSELTVSGLLTVGQDGLGSLSPRARIKYTTRIAKAA